MANRFLDTPAAAPKNRFLDAPVQGPAMPTPEQLRQSRIDTAARTPAGGEHARMGDYSELGPVAEYIGGAGDVLSDAWTMGVKKPLTGVGNMLFGSRADDSTAGERYAAGTKTYDVNLADSEQKSGKLGTGAMVLGTLAAPGPGKAKLTTKLGQGAALGAIEGAARSSDDPFSALKGAAFGGGAGLAGTGIGEGVGKLGEIGLTKLGQAIQNFRASPSLRARLDVFRAGQEAGIGPQDIADAVQRMGPEGMAIDVLGRQGTSLGRRSANLSPEARTVLEDAVSGRKAGQNTRITSTMQDVAGIPAENSRQSVDELVEATRRTMQPPISKAYKDAAAAGYDLPRTPFEDLHKSPMFAKAYQDAESSVLNRTATEGMDAASELARLDETKKILDSIGTSAARSGDLNRAGQAQALARQLRETMDQTMAGPEYSAARSAATKSFGARRAAQRGADLAGGRVAIDAPGQAAATTDPLQRQLQKTGYALQQTENLLNKGSADAAPNLLERPLQQEAIGAVFDPQEAARINERLATERGFNRVARDIQGNSSTARQLAELLGTSAGATATGAGLGWATGLVDPKTGGLLGLGGRVGGKIGRKILDRQAAAAAPELARLLTLPADQLSLQRPMIENIMERAAPATRDALAKLLMRSSVAGGTR